MFLITNGNLQHCYEDSVLTSESHNRTKSKECKTSTHLFISCGAALAGTYLFHVWFLFRITVADGSAEVQYPSVQHRNSV